MSIHSSRESQMPTQDRTTTPRRTKTNQAQKGSRQPPAAPGEDKSKEDQRDLSSQRQTQGKDKDVESPDGVEIGDPVPEDNRTIRARGETGEDEDLPEDNGDIEGSSSERH
jgi:hypothetical protein